MSLKREGGCFFVWTDCWHTDRFSCEKATLCY